MVLLGSGWKLYTSWPKPCELNWIDGTVLEDVNGCTSLKLPLWPRVQIVALSEIVTMACLAYVPEHTSVTVIS